MRSATMRFSAVALAIFPVMAGVLALALAAAPLPAMAMEDDRTDESVLAVPATASGEAAGEKPFFQRRDL